MKAFYSRQKLPRVCSRNLSSISRRVATTEVRIAPALAGGASARARAPALAWTAAPAPGRGPLQHPLGTSSDELDNLFDGRN